MSKYDELVKALRHCSTGKCNDCDYLEPCLRNFTKNNYRFEASIKGIMDDAAAAIEALQAEVKRLKECNDELREAQTYIDHYGDKWMTSAKDVFASDSVKSFVRCVAKGLPTIDAVEVVRCGECKFNYANMIHDPLDYTDYTDIVCTYWMSDGVHQKDYCSKGARMDGERREG